MAGDCEHLSGAGKAKGEGMICFQCDFLGGARNF